MASYSVLINTEQSLKEGQIGQPEFALLLSAQSGDSTAFGKLYEQSYDRVFRFVFYRTSDVKIAEDLTEEVFLKAFQNIQKIKSIEKFLPWLFRVARNQVIDYYRSKKEDASLESIENTVRYEKSVIDELHASDEQQAVISALKQLPEEQQLILKLRFYDELNPEEVSAVLDKKPGHVRVMQHRAISALRAILNSNQK